MTLHWTTDVPTVAGHYWYDWHYSGPEIIYRDGAGEFLVGDRWLTAVEIGSIGHKGKKPVFAGPIPEPTYADDEKDGGK